MDVLIEMVNISKVYGQGNGFTKTLVNLNLTVEKSILIVLMGSSGSGETTPIRIIKPV